MSATILFRELRRLFDLGCTRADIDHDRRHYHGVTFTPPDPVRLYARESVISGAEYGRGPSTQESVGVYQIDVFAPMDEGTRDATDAIDAFRTVFTPGTKVTAHGLTLAIDSASMLSLTQDARTIQLPLSVVYRTWRVPTEVFP